MKGRLDFQKTCQVHISVDYVIPYWMELALKGERIPAIKALREVAHKIQYDDERMRLVHAKNIVDEVMSLRQILCTPMV